MDSEHCLNVHILLHISIFPLSLTEYVDGAECREAQGEHLPTGGNVRELTSCSSAGNLTPLGNANQHTTKRAGEHEQKTQVERRRPTGGSAGLWSGGTKNRTSADNGGETVNEQAVLHDL